MSHIFDTLRGLEDEREEGDSRAPSEIVDLLGLAKGRVAPHSEGAFTASTDENLRPIGSAEARLRIMGLPLMVGGRSGVSLPNPLSTPPAPSIPLPPGPAAVLAAEEPNFKIHQEVAAPIQPEKSLASPAVEPTPKIHHEVSATIPMGKSSDHFVESPLIKLPAGILRAVSLLRTALPYVERILPLFEGNLGAAVSNLLAPPQPAPPAPEPPPVDLAPFKDSLAALNIQYRELREEFVEQDATLRRVDDQLELVRQSTDRNTLQQQELIEDLKSLGNKIGFVTMVALGLLAVSVVVNTVLYLHMVKIIR
jgi:hypothetical protein